MDFLRTLLPESVRPIGYLQNLVLRRTGQQVRSGMFKGVTYTSASQGSAFIPKLLGIYEKELTNAVESIIATQPDRIFNIGAGEGYYAVGMACRLPNTQVIAYELTERGRRLTCDMASKNGVESRVDVRGACEPDDLARELRPQDIIICDVEGYEKKLLNPARIPALESVTVLVELHDFIHRGIADEIRARFDSTHEIACIRSKERSRNEFPYQTLYTRLLPSSYLDWAVSEWRPEQMSWFYMTPQ